MTHITETKCAFIKILPLHMQRTSSSRRCIPLGEICLLYQVTISDMSGQLRWYLHNRDQGTICLTHWGRVTHICVSKLTIIGSDNGLSPDRRQAIIWTNAGILSIGPLGTNISVILIEILTFSFKKMRLKVSSAKWFSFRLGLNVLSCEVTWKVISLWVLSST